MKKVIFVDDDPAIRDALSRILQRAGYEVTAYAHGNHLLTGDFERPDIFILDKQLSGADGLDICRALKQRDDTRQIPVIMLSANPNISILAREACADDFLEKPFKLEDLLELVRRHVAVESA